MRYLTFLIPILVAALWFHSSVNSREMPASEVDALLRESWQAYKKAFIQSDGRVIDHSAAGISTSEGQSYALLRAVWLDDREMFDNVWSWTKVHLDRPEDRLFAWRWGERCDKTWGVLNQESAADADADVAYALILGGNRWKRQDLVEEAKAVLADIWRNEVVEVRGKPYLTAGKWAQTLDQPKLNPSYFAPYAYRLFAVVDRAHNWLGVIDTAYEVLEASSNQSRLGLPPDWCLLNRKEATIAIDRQDKSSDYSYDAMRVPWRIAMDWQLHEEPRARAYLDKLDFLADSWKVTRTIRGAYTATGVMRSFDEPLAGFACALPFFAVKYPEIAQQVLKERVLAFYSDGIWRPERDYYAQNWAWFGIALMHKRLQALKIDPSVTFAAEQSEGAVRHQP